MRILVLNSGSSSLKFQLISTSAAQIRNDADELLTKGLIEKIGAHDAPVKDHAAAAALVFDHLKQRNLFEGIEGVGHRMVHGGERFTHSVVIDDAVAEAVERLASVAPLHNPHNLKGYYESRRFLPNARHVAVFDTAFHHTLPPHAYHYALPYEDCYEKHGIRRYGFHGTSHRYVAQRYARITGNSAAKLISCHLGNGCSMCAIDGGRSIDVSLGFTPLEGLVMGTRGGDVDPGVILHLLSTGAYTTAQLEDMLNRRSGLAGVSGISNDMRDLVRARENGHERARLAVDLFCYRIRKYIGAYLAALNGATAILFTGGIGENAALVRALATENMDNLGIILHPERNSAAAGAEARISADESRTAIWVIPTNEELLIARDTFQCIAGST